MINRPGRIFALLTLCWALPLAAQPAPHEHPPGSGAEQLTLDGSRKWKADVHTLRSVKEMEQIVGEFRSESTASYSALQEKLQKSLDTLIRECTMTGPAHEQLHHWIGALAPEINALGSAERQTAAVTKIKSLLAEFHSHFS